jgi:hypothetical protein
LTMAKLDIHGCIDCIREHFYKADYLKLSYTLPIEAYSLNRQLQHRICDAWKRFEHVGVFLSERECILLAESWLISAKDHTNAMYVNAAWRPKCKNCGQQLMFHTQHPENNPKNDPPDRWLCEAEGGLYEPIEYKKPPFGLHPTDAGVNS